MWCCSSRFDGETVALGLFSTGPGFYMATLGYPILIDLPIIWGYSRLYQYPDAPCMEYLPTFGSCLGQMLVSIPYMEPMGYTLVGKNHVTSTFFDLYSLVIC